MCEYEVFIVRVLNGGRIEARREEKRKGREKEKEEKGKTYNYKCDVRRRRQHLSKPSDSCLLESIEGYTRVRNSVRKK